MKIVRKCLIVFFGLYFLSGCGTPSKDDEISVKNMSMKPQQQTVSVDQTSIATVMNISKSSVQGKPGVTRVIIALDKKASYSTSREGNELVVNVFNAKMESSLKTSFIP